MITASVRRLVSLVAVAAVAAGSVAVVSSVPVAAQPSGFDDVSEGAFYSVAVSTLAEQGVFVGTGCEEGFCPDDLLDRNTMAVWIVRVLDGEDPPAVSQTRFNDVDAAGFYAPFIERMAELEVTSGCGDGSGYCPDATVTRWQMAVFLSRAYNLPDGPDPGFSDVPADIWYAPAVAKLAASGITAGCGRTGYCPSDDTTRAQMATFLWRAENRTEPEGHHPDFSQYEPGDVVHVAELWPDGRYSAGYVCELLDNGEFVDDDGNSNCWQTSEAEPAVARVAEPMQRCASDTGWYGATRVSVYAGTTADGFYEPVVQGGEDSCERIKAWWDQITAAEAQRIAEGQYPCEHGAAYNYFRDETINGPAVLAGCWPRLLWFEVGEEFRLDDPAAEAERLRQLEGSYILPPNHPAMVGALYGCYRDALEGPPPGWTPPTAAGEWPTVTFCHAVLNNYGAPVRYMGVTPECAAGQYAGHVEERKNRGWVSSHGGDQYAGDFSWADCETHASRLLPETMRSLPFTARCEAVIDFTAETHAIDATAEQYGLDRAEYIDETKAMYCEGSRDHLSDYPQFHGELVASWLPPDGSVCFEAALLNAASTGTYGGWTQVKFC